jgi:cytochrome c-type biogenesis protein CcmE
MTTSELSTVLIDSDETYVFNDILRKNREERDHVINDQVVCMRRLWIISMTFTIMSIITTIIIFAIK